MKIPRIVIIDDGISLDYLSQEESFEQYEVCKDIVRVTKIKKGLTHGTACYQIFCNYVKSKYHLISIIVLGGESSIGSKSDLLVALNWCASNNIDLIHMSMGTRQYSDFADISEAIKKLSKTVIVAACSNRNTITFPACLPTVIGVRHCNIKSLKGRYLFVTMPYDLIEIMTYSESHSNSLAAPMISAYACDYLAEGYSDLNIIIEKLKEESVQNASLLCYSVYKELFFKWEEIDVPVIVVSSNIQNVSKVVEKIKNLVNVFIKKGFRAICLSETQETDVEALIFSMDLQMDEISSADLMRLLHNYTLPDIIFLHMDTSHVLFDFIELEPDIIITRDILEMDTKELFNKLKKMLS